MDISNFFKIYVSVIILFFAETNYSFDFSIFKVTMLQYLQMFLLSFLKKYNLVLMISLILFIIPFFWLKPGEMDIGGDSNRLYFYDPIASLTSYGIYMIAPYGSGEISYFQYFIPFLLFVSFLKFIFISPTILIDIFNGLKFSGSFLFMFLIIRELLYKEDGEVMTINKCAACIIGALFYTFSPGIVDNMGVALNTHLLVFLNPIIFYLLLRYLITHSLKYIWIAILITLLFSISFSIHSPSIYAFYLLSIAFLTLYNFLIFRKSPPWKSTCFILLLFLGLHIYHIVPTVSIVFDKGSQLNTRVFEGTKNVNLGLEYFNAILPLGKVSEHIFMPLADRRFSWNLFIIPLLTILGFMSAKKKNKTLLLLGIFFLITLFLTSANITNIGVEFYRKLFSIPGFGMFRNFYGQWQWVHAFFYALLAGLAISSLFFQLKRKYIYLTTFVVVSLIFARSWIFFNGDLVNITQRGSENLKVIVRMDPHYEQMLSYIKSIQNEGRILHMPFTDFAYNIVGGANKGVYIGQSMPSLLLGKNDYPGYQDIDPYSEVFVKLVKEENYPLIKQMMALLQIRYILYNSDEIVSSKFFPGFPYGYTGTPTSQTELQDFVQNISKKKIYEIGHYSLYEVDKDQYLPLFYAVSNMYIYDTNPKYDIDYSRALSFFPKETLAEGKDPRIAFVDRVFCTKILSKQICDQNNLHADIKDIQIMYQRINPTKYKLIIKNATKPFLLVFQNDFNLYWKIYQINTSVNTKNVSDSYYNGGIIELVPENQIIDNNPFETNNIKAMYDNTHIQVNGYANGWYIKPSEYSGKEDYEVIIEMIGQKFFYYSFIISLMSLLIFLFVGIQLFLVKKGSGTINH